MIWDTELFIKEFEIFKTYIDESKLPGVFKKQIKKINDIVNHWKVCYPCRLGFYCCQYNTTFEEVWLNLIFYPIDYHTCDGDYKLLFHQT